MIGINEVLSRLKGKQCWATLGGGAAGSVYALLIGQKLPRVQPIGNDMLNVDAQNFDGEYRLMIKCAWRLDEPNSPIVSWLGPVEPEGLIVKSMERLEGTQIVDARAKPPAWDLVLDFSNDLRLTVFCSKTSAVEFNDNWHLFVNRKPVGAVQPAGGWVPFE